MYFYQAVQVLWRIWWGGAGRVNSELIPNSRWAQSHGKGTKVVRGKRTLRWYAPNLPEGGPSALAQLVEWGRTWMGRDGDCAVSSPNIPGSLSLPGHPAPFPLFMPSWGLLFVDGVRSLLGSHPQLSFPQFGKLPRTCPKSLPLNLCL